MVSDCERCAPMAGGGGTRIWIGRGWAGSSRPIPMVTGSFAKIGPRYPYLDIFQKGVSISCDFATKPPNFPNLGNPGSQANSSRDFCMKMGPTFTDFLQNLNPFWPHIPVCLNMWAPRPTRVLILQITLASNHWWSLHYKISLVLLTLK